MPTFDYQGRDITGKLLKGKRLAQSADNLSSLLLKEGITPVLITPAKEDVVGAWEALKDIFQSKHVSTEELSMFSRQMHVLTKTGVPITSAMKQLAENARSQSLGDALRNIVESLESGQDLAGAMSHSPKVFTPLMISMIRVGQDSGRLDEAFLRLNQYLELESVAMKRLKTALRYPMFVILAIVSAIIAVNIFVIPVFAHVFKTANIPLPIFTVILINISTFFREYWLPIFASIIFLVLWVRYYIKTPKGELAWSRYQLKVPVLGKILKRIILLRFAQTFAITVNSGITLVEGLRLVADALDNRYAQFEIMTMQEAIQHGKGLTQAASASDLFTPLEIQMLGVSEETGELGSMLEQIAYFYQREVEYDLKRLSDIIEPVILIALAIMVLILALAIYLPMWNMVNLVHA